MKVLDLFDVYFLSMMLIQGTVVFTLDARDFKKSGMGSIGKKARILGGLAIVISMVLFVLRWIS